MAIIALEVARDDHNESPARWLDAYQAIWAAECMPTLAPPTPPAAPLDQVPDGITPSDG